MNNTKTKNLASLLKQLLEGKNDKILILDPSDQSKTLIKSFLKQVGVKDYLTANNTAEAKRLMLTSKIKLIISEWMLGAENGAEFCRAIRKIPQYRSTPFILMSGDNGRSDIVLASEVYIDRYLVKPFSFDTFASQLTQVCQNTLNPSLYEEQIKSGNLHFLLGDIEASEKHFKQASSLNPRAAIPLLGLAKVELARNNLDSAQIFIDNTLSLNFDYVDAHRTQLRLYQLKGNQDGVYKEAEYLHKISPNNPRYLIIMAEQNVMEGNLAIAEDFYKKAIKQSNKIAKAHKGLGDVYFAKKDFDKAERSYQKAIDIEPEDLSCINQLGLTFVRKGHLSEGIQMYMTGLKIDPENAKLLFNLGKAYETAEDFKNALTYFSQSLAMSPGFKKAQKAVERISTKEISIEKTAV